MSLSISEAKRELRSRMRARLREHATGPKPLLGDSLKVLELLRHEGLWQQAEEIIAFASMRLELPTDPLIEEAVREGRRVALPRITPDGLSFHYLSEWPPRFSSGPMSLREPSEDWPRLDLTRHADLLAAGGALFLCPGMAFDRRGGRLGWGGGYYDRILAQLARHTRQAHQAHQAHQARPAVAALKGVVGLGFELQIVEHVPMDAHDLSLGMLCTPAEMIYCTEASQGVSSET